MTAVATIPALRADAWEAFVRGPWTQRIDVRDFILRNFTPYTGDASFLAGPTARTLTVWQTLQRDYLAVERAKRVYDVDTHIPADVDAFPAGYISDQDTVIVGLQTDTPLKRPMMPNGGWRMVETAIAEAGSSPTSGSRRSSPSTARPTTKLSSTSTPRGSGPPAVRTWSPACPDAYGRGRIIGDYRRVALYGVDALIEAKRAALNASVGQPFSEDWARRREEHAEQIKALRKLKNLGESYGFDLSRPATTFVEAVQWTYFAYLASVKSQDGAAMSIGRLSGFFDVYAERDLVAGLLTESEAQEVIDALVTKLRIVRFLRTIDYDQIFSGDPYWATWSDGGFADDGRTLVTKTSFRLLQTLRNLGPAPEPNITIYWDPALPAGLQGVLRADLDRDLRDPVRVGRRDPRPLGRRQRDRLLRVADGDRQADAVLRRPAERRQGAAVRDQRRPGRGQRQAGGARLPRCRRRRPARLRHGLGQVRRDAHLGGGRPTSRR